MAIENTQCSVTVTGNGTVPTIPVTFPVKDASHLVVTGFNASNVPFTYTQGTNYTVNIIANPPVGGTTATVVLKAALASGWKLTVSRRVPLVQSSVFNNQSGIDPKVMENCLDYLTMADQQLQDQISRCMEVPTGMSVADVKTLLQTVNTSLTNLRALIDGLAPLDSPAFINNPTAPTAKVGDNSKQVANTEFVSSAVATKASKESVEAKADKNHKHTLDDVANLNSTLTTKVRDEVQTALPEMFSDPFWSYDAATRMLRLNSAVTVDQSRYWVLQGTMLHLKGAI